MTNDPTPVPSHHLAGPRRGRRWIADVSNREVIGYAVWLIGNFAVSLAATLIIVHRALALPRGTPLGSHYLMVWAASSGGSLVLLSILGGAVLFKRRTPWDVVLTWPWLVGPVVGAGYLMALAGKMDGGSKLCDAPAGSSCDNAWALGAILLSFVAAGVLGGICVAVASFKRLILRPRSNG